MSLRLSQRVLSVDLIAFVLNRAGQLVLIDGNGLSGFILGVVVLILKPACVVKRLVIGGLIISQFFKVVVRLKRVFNLGLGLVGVCDVAGLLFVLDSAVVSLVINWLRPLEVFAGVVFVVAAELGVALSQGRLVLFEKGGLSLLWRLDYLVELAYLDRPGLDEVLLISEEVLVLCDVGGLDGIFLKYLALCILHLRVLDGMNGRPGSRN